MDRLTNLEQHALEELLRIHVLRSTDRLTGVDTIRVESQPLKDETSTRTWVVRQRIGGDLDGEGWWSVTDDDSRALVRKLRKVDVGRHGLTSLEREALAEVGYTFINGMLDGLTSALNVALFASVPVVRRVDGGSPLPEGLSLRAGLVQQVRDHRYVAQLGLSWRSGCSGGFQRALALYVSPFLAELS